MEKNKTDTIIKRLRKRYPSPQTALAYRTPFELLAATILSAQCTDKKVNEVTQTLFKKYPSVEAFASADTAALEKDIYQTGFYRNKAKNLIAAAKKLCDTYSAAVPDTMAELITLPGVARKTANIVLSSAFKKAEGIAVDTHVKRLANRLGISSQGNPDKIEQDLMRLVPKKDWIDFNYMLVNHGRETCQAKKPMCGACVLRDLCPFPDSDFNLEAAKAELS